MSGAREQVHQTRTPLRQGSYRCLAGTGNNFARECYMDELAHSIGMDPLEFRIENSSNDDRLVAVMQAAAGRFGWKNRKKAPGRGFGMAAGFEKGGHVATFAEVGVTAGAIKVLRVVEAFECGAVINPEHLRNQIEGAIAMGLGGALFERVDFADGKIATNRLARYRVPRFADMPVIETVLVDRKDLAPVGAGECPIMGVAPPWETPSSTPPASVCVRCRCCLFKPPEATPAEWLANGSRRGGGSFGGGSRAWVTAISRKRRPWPWG
jgi:isoquinoline 1-oxidoreductase